MNDLTKKQNYYFIGILGSGMSGLARFTYEMGHNVGGSDRNLSNEIKTEFEKLNIDVYEQDGTGIEKFAFKHNINVNDIIVIKSTAIEDNVSDIVYATKNNLTILHRSDLLASFFNNSKNSIAIAGTCGKTSVSTMTTFMIDKCIKPPSFVIGGISRNFNTSSRFTNFDYFVIEADESDGTIIKYKPYISILTNISKDHKEMNELFDLFSNFLLNTQKNGYVILNLSCPNVKKLYANLKNDLINSQVNVITLNFDYNQNNYDNTNYLVKDIQLTENGSNFKINNVLFNTKLIGKHNIENLSLAIVTTNILGASLESISSIINEYIGVARRLEVVGKFKDITIIDDYAHNPHEIKTAINAVKIFNKPIIAVYQPHGYGPTALTFNELINAFNDLGINDMLFISEIYYAGGTVQKTVTGNDLATKVSENLKNTPVYFCNLLSEIEDKIINIITNSDNKSYIILVMGARNINTICKNILNKLNLKYNNTIDL